MSLMSFNVQYLTDIKGVISYFFKIFFSLRSTYNVSQVFCIKTNLVCHDCFPPSL